MDYIFYYNNKLYALFLSISFVVVCFALSYAENYLIPPAHREIDGIKEYLSNEIEQEHVSKELLDSAEEFCLGKIKEHENIELYRSQLLKIYFDRIFLRNFNNPLWVEKHIKRDKRKLTLIDNQKEKDTVSERIEKYEQQLDKLKERKAHLKKFKKTDPQLPVAILTQ